MYRFLESIAVVDGKVQRLPWHQRRVDHTLAAHYKRAIINLDQTLTHRAREQQGTVKCRVIYASEILEIQFAPYIPKIIKTLKLVENNDINYAFKFEDREAINNAFNQRGDCNDILVVKNGLITDSSIANIVFRRGERWVTPHEPLLRGTMRDYLLASRIISEDEIRVRDLPSFDGFKLINAMLGFSSMEYPISNIHF